MKIYLYLLSVIENIRLLRGSLIYYRFYIKPNIIIKVVLYTKCNGIRARHLPKSAIFYHFTIGLLITSALAAPMVYLFTLPPIYTSSSSF